MPDLQHLGWPYTLGATVIQGTADELKASAAVIVCTQRGDRHDDPAFGVTNPIFGRRPVDTQRLVREIQQTDQRLELTASDVVDLANAMQAVVPVEIAA